MKKGLLIGLGVAAVGIVAAIIVLPGGKEESEERPVPAPERYIEVGPDQAPFVSITPSGDGHWLTVKISRIQDAQQIEYELSYDTAAGVNQGAIGGPYTVPTNGEYEKAILLGTESSGHFNYHQGVKRGNLTVRLYGGIGARKFEADFVLLEPGDELASADGQLTVNEIKFSDYLVMMPTFGLPAQPEVEIVGNPYGVFAAKPIEVTLTDVNLGEGELLFWNGKRWVGADEGHAIRGYSMAFIGLK